MTARTSLFIACLLGAGAHVGCTVDTTAEAEDAKQEITEVPFSGDFDGKADSYGVVNLYTGVRDNAGVWEVSAWATNLFDEDAEISKMPVEVYNAEFTGYRQANVLPERAFGLTGRYNF